MAPSMVVLLNTPLILLPILLMPNDSPRFNRILDERRNTASYIKDTKSLISRIHSEIIDPISSNNDVIGHVT